MHHSQNSMAMVYGYSSNQLEFRSNPNLPNIINGGLPALEGKTFECSTLSPKGIRGVRKLRKNQKSP